ncbi:hypothetical protein DL96DRAFT_1822713 [Flagelloscypha sp. PMI_526]|nr:hypothetical protein DL96DRAFT_1822713 [Flagelloscypha sp. PMI_526]
MTMTEQPGLENEGQSSGVFLNSFPSTITTTEFPLLLKMLQKHVSLMAEVFTIIALTPLPCIRAVVDIPLDLNIWVEIAGGLGSILFFPRDTNATMQTSGIYSGVVRSVHFCNLRRQPQSTFGLLEDNRTPVDLPSPVISRIVDKHMPKRMSARLSKRAIVLAKRPSVISAYRDIAEHLCNYRMKTCIVIFSTLLAHFPEPSSNQFPSAAPSPIPDPLTPPIFSASSNPSTSSSHHLQLSPAGLGSTCLSEVASLPRGDTNHSLSTKLLLPDAFECLRDGHTLRSELLSSRTCAESDRSYGFGSY